MVTRRSQTLATWISEVTLTLAQRHLTPRAARRLGILEIMLLVALFAWISLKAAIGGS